MFLGWITLALFLLIMDKLPVKNTRTAKWALFIFQVSVLSLALSFPSSGYGLLSVTFLGINMASAFVIAFIIFRSGASMKTPGWKMIRAGLFFMLLSGLGPLALGPVAAMGLKNTVWYDFSVYFYLHFQYNGWFFLTLTGLVIAAAPPSWLTDKSSLLNKTWIALVISVILTYSLSVINRGYTLAFNILGGVGAIAQLVIILVILFRPGSRGTDAMQGFGKNMGMLFGFSLIALIVKMVLQVLSAFPVLAGFAFGQRNIIVAYLHLVLIGFVSFGVIALYHEIGWFRNSPGYSIAVSIFAAGFFLNEFALLVSVAGGITILIPKLLFAAALIMTLGIAGIVFATRSPLNNREYKAGL